MKGLQIPAKILFAVNISEAQRESLGLAGNICELSVFPLKITLRCLSRERSKKKI
jgi:hypothetical protein